MEVLPAPLGTGQDSIHHPAVNPLHEWGAQAEGGAAPVINVIPSGGPQTPV